MRRMLIVALAISAVLLCSRPAQAFHHRSYQPVASGPFSPAAAPFGASPAAPVSPALILQLLGIGYQLLNTGQNNGFIGNLLPGNRTGTTTTTRPEPVPDDVVQTINRVDAALPALVEKTNSIKAMNPLYAKVTDVKVSAASQDNTGSITTGTLSGPPPKH